MRWLAITIALMMETAGASAAETTVTLAVENMTCVTCPITVRTAIKGVAGVRNVTVDFAKKLAVVVFEDTLTSPDKVADAARNAGFPATRKD